ncbi:MAG: hypothetical protein SGJ27_03610 [Candidatus Melainabacteria bacterium]|nr:hypothetical protein [Candidatus Melainabacteria bacterium]
MSTLDSSTETFSPASSNPASRALFDEAYQITSDTDVGSDTGDSPKGSASDTSNESSIFSVAHSASSSSGLEATRLQTSEDTSLAAFDMNAFQLVDAEAEDDSKEAFDGTAPENSKAEFSAPEANLKKSGDAEENLTNTEKKNLTGAEIDDRINKLDSDSSEEREQARRDLVEAQNRDRVLERLRETYKNPASLEQQTQAQRAIGEMGEDLKGKDSDKKRESLSDEKIKKLIDGLDADTFQEREDATRALSQAGNPEDVMRHLAETAKTSHSPEQQARARQVAEALGANASPEQLNAMHSAMNSGDNTKNQRRLYESALNGGLAASDGPMSFKDSQGRVTGIYDGSLDNAIMTARYNAAGQVEQATIRGTTFDRKEDGTYSRSDGFSEQNVTVSENGVRFSSADGSSIEWQPSGSTAFFDKGGRWTSTHTKDGRTITPEGTDFQRLRDLK